MSRTAVNGSRTAGDLRWLAVAGWVVVGVLWALTIAGMMTIGVFVLPVAVIGTVLMRLRPAAREGWTGVLAGPGVIACYIGYLNRGGPGTVCSTTPGGGSTCTDAMNPWPFLAVGLIFLIGAVLATVLVLHHRGRVRPTGPAPA